MIQSFSKCATTFLTHAFEHGHPDHDAICIAVHIAARRSKQKVEIFECALYRAEADQLVFSTQFDGHLLSSCERNRKEAALACFVSQREFIARFPTDREIYEKVNLRNATDMDDFLYRYPNDIPSEALPEHWQRMASLLEAATS